MVDIPHHTRQDCVTVRWGLSHTCNTGHVSPGVCLKGTVSTWWRYALYWVSFSLLFYLFTSLTLLCLVIWRRLLVSGRCCCGVFRFHMHCSQCCVCTGHESCVELLLERSQKHELVGNAFTPLHCAVWVPAVLLYQLYFCTSSVTRDSVA